MENKSNKGIIIALVLVIVILIGSITYMSVSGTVSLNVKDNKTEEKDNNKEENKEEDKKEESKEEVNNDKNNSEEEKNEVKELSLNDPLVEKLYNYVTVNTGYNEVVDFYAKYGTITNKEVTDEIKLMTALTIGKLGDRFKYVRSESAVLGEVKIYELEKEVIVNEINKIFGKDNGYQHINGSIMLPFGSATNIDCATVKYNSASGKYEIHAAPGCGGVVAHSVYNKLIAAEQNKDTITLTQKIYVASGFNIYKTFDLKDVIATNVNENSDNNQEYFDKGATTKYTFKLADDGSYYFESKTTN